MPFGTKKGRDDDKKQLPTRNNLPFLIKTRKKVFKRFYLFPKYEYLSFTFRGKIAFLLLTGFACLRRTCKILKPFHTEYHNYDFLNSVMNPRGFDYFLNISS